MTIDPSSPIGDLAKRLEDVEALAERLTSYDPAWRPVRNKDGSWCVHGPNGVCIASTGKDAFAEARARFIAALDPALVRRLAATLSRRRGDETPPTADPGAGALPAVPESGRRVRVVPGLPPAPPARTGDATKGPLPPRNPEPETPRLARVEHDANRCVWERGILGHPGVPCPLGYTGIHGAQHRAVHIEHALAETERVASEAGFRAGWRMRIPGSWPLTAEPHPAENEHLTQWWKGQAR